MGAAGELGLYVHLPFCPARCPYCDFFAKPYDHAEALPLWEGLAFHLALLPPLASGRPLAHLYLGGGTPSMLPVHRLAGLIAAIDQTLGIKPGAEVTLEANPGTLSRLKLAGLRRAGVGRLSIGAQSLDDGLLRALGRRHSAADVARAVAQARAAGFNNLSLDLIYGLPGQDPERAAADLAAALALKPDHLSLYELTLADETPFGRRYAKGRPPLPREDALAAMEETAWQMIARAGLSRYEVSNYARPGHECRHNQSTWRGGDYLALGPGAWGHLAGRRWRLTEDIAAYTAAARAGREPVEEEERLKPLDRAREVVMLGLRTVEGVDLAWVAGLLEGGPPPEWQEAWAELARRGWARLEGDRLRPTPAGLAMADAAAGLFF